MKPRKLTGCSACGGNHRSVIFRKMTIPIDKIWTHWAQCPKNGNPILMRLT